MPLNQHRPLSDTEYRFFTDNGYLVVHDLVPNTVIDTMRNLVTQSLHPPLGPLEYEAEVQYPGAPSGLEMEGGLTPRRLLHAYSRDEVFRRWAHSPVATSIISQLLRTDRVMLTQCHHNCIMTKSPRFSSETGWHQDIRYWQFENSELISSWLALGNENEENGCMHVIPGSHLLDYEPDQFDEAAFFRSDLETNRSLIRQSVSVELKPGDVMFFHARTLHAAGSNRTRQIKAAVVFSYHAEENRPVPGTRSARLPGIVVNAR